MTDTKRPREFYLYPVIGENFDNLNQEWIVSYDNDDGRQTIHVREVIEGEPDWKELYFKEMELMNDARNLITDMIKYKSLCESLAAALEAFLSINHIDWNKVSHYQTLRQALSKYREAIR